MSCYTRHLEQPIRAAGLPFDRDGKREADRRIRLALDMQNADCPAVWAHLKHMTSDEIRDLIAAPLPR